MLKCLNIQKAAPFGVLLHTMTEEKNQADKLPSMFGLMLLRSWIFGLSLLIAIPVWKIFHVSLAITTGIGMVVYGTVLLFLVFAMKVPQGLGWVKLTFIGIPIMIVLFGLAAFSYGYYGKDCLIAPVLFSLGVAACILPHFFTHICARRYLQRNLGSGREF